MRAGGSTSFAPATGSDSRMMAWAAAAAGPHARSAAQSAHARRAARPPRMSRFTALAPVVEHQVVRVLVVFLLAPLHTDHGEVRVVSALEKRLVRGAVVGIDEIGREHG